jgi:uridine kinase
MRGDKLVIQKYHENASQQIATILMPQISAVSDKSVISVAGESGVGKSEIAFVLNDLFNKNGISSFILQQDDYFVYPPKTNAAMRLKDIGHVGLSEVRLRLLEQNLGDFISGKGEIRKPLVIFEEDRIIEETLSLENIKVLIVEGTYTTTLKNVQKHVFIDRTYEDSREARKRRSREKQDDFLERVLMIEHDIISSHKSEADIIVTKDYEAIAIDD